MIFKLHNEDNSKKYIRKHKMYKKLSISAADASSGDEVKGVKKKESAKKIFSLLFFVVSNSNIDFNDLGEPFTRYDQR